jgi:hypothetical protein
LSARTRDGDRWLELAVEMGTRLGGVLRDVVPPEAQFHLLNAQRELITAMVIIYEHQAGSRRAEPAGKRRSARPRRLNRIPVE